MARALTVLALLTSCCMADLLAQSPVQPRPEQGHIEASGKFSPGGKTSQVLGKTPKSREEAQAALMKLLEVTPVDENTFKIGSIQLNKRERSVTIPATVNMREGIVEYALVGEAGKSHEAIFVTQASPQQAHMACLLVGAKPQDLQIEPNKPFVLPEGCRITTEVRWSKHGPDAIHSLEALVLDQELEASKAPVEKKVAPVPSKDWWYCGSRLGPGGFVAQQEHSFIALISDSGALVNDPRSIKNLKDHYYPNTRLLPTVGTPVRITLRFDSVAVPPKR